MFVTWIVIKPPSRFAPTGSRTCATHVGGHRLLINRFHSAVQQCFCGWAILSAGWNWLVRREETAVGGTGFQA